MTAAERLEALREQRQSLAPEAATDPTAAAQLEDVEREIAECERSIERASLARTELARRGEAAAAAAAAERQARARERVQELDQAAAKIAAQIDRDLARFAKGLSEYHLVEEQRRAALRAAGEAKLLYAAGLGSPLQKRLVLAVSHAMKTAEVPTHLLKEIGRSSFAKPLAESDPIAQMQRDGIPDVMR
jgi:hypothetical protein